MKFSIKEFVADSMGKQTSLLESLKVLATSQLHQRVGGWYHYSSKARKYVRALEAADPKKLMCDEWTECIDQDSILKLRPLLDVERIASNTMRSLVLSVGEFIILDREYLQKTRLMIREMLDEVNLPIASKSQVSTVTLRAIIKARIDQTLIEKHLASGHTYTGFAIANQIESNILAALNKATIESIRQLETMLLIKTA